MTKAIKDLDSTIKCNRLQLSKKDAELDEYRATVPQKDEEICQLRQEKQLLASKYAVVVSPTSTVQWHTY